MAACSFTQGEAPKLSHDALTMVAGTTQTLEADFEVEEWSATPKNADVLTSFLEKLDG